MQKIIPHLWFDKEAEEAVDFYLSSFKDGSVISTTHYTEVGHDIHGMEAGTAMTVEFEIEGYRFIALNGGPIFKFTPAISFMVSRPTKEEVNELWEKLSDGGTVLMPLDSYPFSTRYGWIQDKYGVSWQIGVFDQMNESRIIPSLLFTREQAGKAEEAITFYTSVFKDGKIDQIVRYGDDISPDPEGPIMYADFTITGQKFAAMDSGIEHDFIFTEAISLLVVCEDQEEIDYLWEKLSAVPESEQCGWLKDQFGVSWQIAPKGMEKMLNDSDTEKANRAMEAMLQMKKIDIEALEKAYQG